jgi:hypothetical protein
VNVITNYVIFQLSSVCCSGASDCASLSGKRHRSSTRAGSSVGPSTMRLCCRCSSTSQCKSHPISFPTKCLFHSSTGRFFLQSPASPDLLYLVHFIHTQLTTTVTLAFLFGSKVSVHSCYVTTRLMTTLPSGLFSVQIQRQGAAADDNQSRFQVHGGAQECQHCHLAPGFPREHAQHDGKTQLHSAW